MQFVENVSCGYRACLAIALATKSIEIKYIVADSGFVQF